MILKSNNFFRVVLISTVSMLLGALLCFLAPSKTDRYRIYNLKSEKIFRLSTSADICVILPKGTRVYSKDVRGPSHEVGNEVILPILLNYEELERDFSKGEVVDWPPAPYIAKQ